MDVDKFYKEYNRKMKVRQRIEIFLSFLIIVGTLLFSIFYVMRNFNVNEYTATVTKAERVNSEYLVYTEDNTGDIRVFKNTDSFIRFKFNSSDLYGAIKEGKTYVFTVVGYRIPLLSWYENIIDVRLCE